MAQRSKNKGEVKREGADSLRFLFGAKREWIFGLILLLIVFLVYQPVWHAGFIWDDDNHVTINPVIVGPLGLKEIWTTSAARICPLVLTSFWVEHALWGLNPLPYHLVNILLHGASSILLWRILRHLQIPGAWLGAALWAVHPVEVESVAWITEMKNTQSGFFYLLSIFFFVKYLRSEVGSDSKTTCWNYALMLLFAAMAIASKSSTVILPLVLCLCAWWVESRWNWRNLARVAPVFLMSVAASVVSMWTQNLEGANDMQVVRTWPERLATSGDVIWFYLGKLIWPHPLIFIYPRWVIETDKASTYLPLLAIVIVAYIFWHKRDSWARPWFFALAYFIVALLPVLGLVNHFFLRYSFVGDHFQYLASIGPLALAGAGLAKLADVVIPGRPWLQSSLCAGLLLIFSAQSWHRTRVYENVETLWADTLAKNPNCWLADNNLGHALLQRGQVDDAMARFQRALEINPREAQAHYNLGLALYHKREVDEAMAEFQTARDINPLLAEPWYNIGNILLQKGRVDEAIDLYEKALGINSNYAEAHLNLGIALMQKGIIDGAMTEFQKALEINPGNAEAHNNLGIALARKGQFAEAMAQFQEALRLNPNYGEAQRNLGQVHALMR